MIRKLLLVSALVLVVAGAMSPASAQKPVTQAAVVTETSVIQAIDTTNRLVSLKNDDGTIDTIYAGPDVLRFNELKVGDKVTFRYYESVVYAIQQPGTKPPEGVDVAITRREGGTPAGTMSQQQTAVVTVNAIDMKAPSITITSADGSKTEFKVEDKKNLAGVKAGDKIQITYTRALAISVEPPKK
ncbi:MAG: hypothetical protein NTY02_06410 [Acidobacteria bacterium]|nr:hypothetical protein [Acidobacteriota bacterium]